MENAKRSFLVLVFPLVMFGCAKDGPAPVAPASEPVSSAQADPSESSASADAPAEAALSLKEKEQAAFEAAKPVFEEYCAHCHGSSGSKKALKHFRMDSYPFKGHHAHEIGALVRKSLGVDGGEITMPSDDKGAVKGKELELIVAWSRAFDAAQGDGKAEDDHHDAHHHKKGHSH
jgi:mono/diheme cytochrome c family protein